MPTCTFSVSGVRRGAGTGERCVTPVGRTSFNLTVFYVRRLFPACQLS